MKGHPGITVALAVITASAYLRRDPGHFTHAIFGRWRRWWLAALAVDVVVLAVVNL